MHAKFLTKRTTFKKKKFKKTKFNFKIMIFTGLGSSQFAILSLQHDLLRKAQLKRMNKTAADRFPSFGNPSDKSVSRQITLDLTAEEAKMLESYCARTGKEVTDVIQELIQELPGV
ncbi:hypothetical protein NUACC21_19730 [Scytonema sp. NUACC21]